MATASKFVAPRYTVDDIRYDAATHTSFAPDGREVPHVTAVLSAVRVSTNFDKIREMGAKRAEAIEYAAALGTAVHADCHAYDDDDLDTASVPAEQIRYVAAWAQCRADLGLVPLKRERRLFHPTQFYTGIEDGVFILPTGAHVLGDLKIGDPDDAAGHLQTAAYEAAEKATDPTIRIDQRWAIHLDPDLAVPYRIYNYTSRSNAWQDVQKFYACMTVYREQPARRR